MSTTRWNIAVSAETDRSLRLFLADQGGSRKGELSRFVEEAVRARIFQLAAERAKSNNRDAPEPELSAVIEEAVGWARNH
jgi:hypothetical protein